MIADPYSKLDTSRWQNSKTLHSESFERVRITLSPPKKHELATSLVKLDDVELIDLVFDVDEFVRDIVIRELTYRGRFDREIYRIGEYGNDLARSAAIAIFKERILSNASCPKQRDE